MGLFDGFLGNASEVDSDAIAGELEPILCDGESIEHACRLIRDLLVFTDKRLIIVDKQGISGKKTEYLSIPYKSIVRYSIESAGHFDMDSELKIWVSGQHEPIEKEFSKSSNVQAIYRIITSHVCK